MSELGSYRNDGPDTMFEGARAVGDKVSSMRKNVLAIFTDLGPLTDRELWDEYGKRHGNFIDRSVGTRRRELVDAGVLCDSGVRKINPQTGVRNIVWARK